MKNIPDNTTGRPMPVRSMGETEMRMHNNPVLHGVQVGLIRENQIDQALAARGNLADPLLDASSVGNRFNLDKLLERKHILSTRQTESYAMLNIVDDAAPKFVIYHDWAKILGSVTDSIQDEEVLLPYPKVLLIFHLFEGKVAFFATQDQSGEVPGPIELQPTRWKRNVPIDLDYYKRQTKALCVALDAELATQEKPTVDEHKLQAITELSLPRNRYTVVRPVPKVAKRVGTKNECIEPKVRLHWRRGHLRTYKASGKRVWVRWCLVGSPLVGNVDKHYEC